MLKSKQLPPAAPSARALRPGTSDSESSPRLERLLRSCCLILQLQALLPVHSKYGEGFAQGLAVDAALHAFIEDEVLPGSGVLSHAFWAGLASAAEEFGNRTRALLAERERLQAALDSWHVANPGPVNVPTYTAFLREIGYLQPDVGDFAISPSGVDAEITVAAPQLVVPITNARFALNAVNARWGSLYDALYGSDCIEHGGDLSPAGAYNPARGARVIAAARDALNTSAPLQGGKSWSGSYLSIPRGARLSHSYLIRHNSSDSEAVLNAHQQYFFDTMAFTLRRVD